MSDLEKATVLLAIYLVIMASIGYISWYLDRMARR
jgi:hypothetical protein